MILLGDGIARFLGSAGITKERVSRIAGVEDCGCDSRRDAANQIGIAAQIRLRVLHTIFFYRMHAAKQWASRRFGLSCYYLRKAFMAAVFGIG